MTISLFDHLPFDLSNSNLTHTLDELFRVAQDEHEILARWRHQRPHSGGGLYALHRLRRGLQRRRIPRVHHAYGMGKFGHLPLHRPLGRRSSMGHLHHRLLDHRRRRARAAHPHQEPHLHHLLRGRRHLRRHHGHRLLRQAGRHPGRRALRRPDALHGLCALLVRADRRHVQPGLRRRGGRQRERRGAGGRGRSYAVRQDSGHRNFQLCPRTLWLDRGTSRLLQGTRFRGELDFVATPWPGNSAMYGLAIKCIGGYGQAEVFTANTCCHIIRRLRGEHQREQALG